MRIDDHGFSLLEAIVAIGVIGLVSTAIFDLLIGPGMRRSADVALLENLLVARDLLAGVNAQPSSSPREEKIAVRTGEIWTVRIQVDSEANSLYRAEIIPAGTSTPILSTLIRRRRP